MYNSRHRATKGSLCLIRKNRAVFYIPLQIAITLSMIKLCKNLCFALNKRKIYCCGIIQDTTVQHWWEHTNFKKAYSSFAIT